MNATGDRGTANRGTGPAASGATNAAGQPGAEVAAQDARKRDQDRAFYKVVLEPMWTGYVNELVLSGVSYRRHLLALECLKQARGSGPDVVGLATFVRDWGWLATFPVIGAVPLIRKLGKPTGLLGDAIHSLKGKTTNSALQPRGDFTYRKWFERSFSQVAAFDFTKAIGVGIAIIGAMVPLLAKLQFNNAILAALDDKVVPKGDQAEVGGILQSTGSADRVVAASREALERFRNAWDHVMETGEQMARIADELDINAK